MHEHVWKNNITFAECRECGERRGWQPFIEENARLRVALQEIAKGEGAFSRDPLIHAGNTIENMKDIALEALEPAD